MAENCLTNSVVRDGTSQQQRLLRTLLPEYVSVDERKIDQLKEFVIKYSELIQYYDPDSGEKSQTWKEFFTTQTLSEEQQTSPHYALFQSFLELFQVAQEDLNTLTKRHLDFYYREVLHFEEEEPVSDQVFILLELAKHVADQGSLVDQGTRLKAGKDELGNNVYYKTTSDLVVNKAFVKELKNIYFNQTDESSTATLGRLYKSPIANSGDGLGGDIETDSQSWLPFGNINRESATEITRETGELGFSIASPILFLAEGTREITFTLNVDAINIQLGSSLTKLFSVQFSGEKGWLKAETTTEVEISSNQLIIKATLTADDPSVVAYDKEVLLQAYDTDWPVAEVFLEIGNSTDYELLKDLKLNNVTIEVDVKELSTLIVQNDQTVMDPSKLMLPFGLTPVLGSNFYIGSQEAFQKELTSLSIDLQWNGLPQDDKGFADHYANYGTPVRTNASFTVGASVLDQKEWKSIDDVDTVQLFGVGVGKVSAVNKIDLSSDPQDPLNSPNPRVVPRVPRDERLESFDRFDTLSRKGFIRLQLNGTDFGHGVFQSVYANAVLSGFNANNDGKFSGKLPKAPYTPELLSVKLNYTSSVSIKFDSANPVEQYFHIQPFGVEERLKTFEQTSISEKSYMLPQFNNEGELYIGIENIAPPQNVSILFQVVEGSEDPTELAVGLTYSYYTSSGWKVFNNGDVLSDTTRGLTTSGIVLFSFPKDAINEISLLTDGLFWIRVGVTSNTRNLPEFVAIQAQAVVAEFQDNSNDPEYLANALPAESIGKLEFSDSSINKIAQPYASFGGKVRELDNNFYTRVSERLRHKNRAITVWDYEHLTLQQFPEVYLAKCMNHTSFLGTPDISSGTELKDVFNAVDPGNVSLVIVSNVENKNAVDPIRPKTSVSTLKAIGEYLQGLNSSDINFYDPIAQINSASGKKDQTHLYVQNPIYEGIRVNFQVKFNEGIDFGFYRRQLESEIKAFLAPWAFGLTTDITLGGKIHQSSIINFIDERPYVDFATCFEMRHFAPGDLEGILTDEAVATTGASVLTSVGKINSFEDHGIEEVQYDAQGRVTCGENTIEPQTILPTDGCSCEEDVLDSDGTGPVGFVAPDLELCPPQNVTSLGLTDDECAETDERPVVTKCVFEDADNETYFEPKTNDSVTILQTNKTYLIPAHEDYATVIPVLEILSNNRIVIQGSFANTSFDRIEVMTAIFAEHKYTINTLLDDGENTIVQLNEAGNDIKVGDIINIFDQSKTQDRFKNICLPVVTSEMVSEGEMLAIQVLIGNGTNTQLKPATVPRDSGNGTYPQQFQSDPNDDTFTTVANHALEFFGGQVSKFSIKLEAYDFGVHENNAYDRYGWKAVAENENYYLVCEDISSNGDGNTPPNNLGCIFEDVLDTKYYNLFRGPKSPTIRAINSTYLIPASKEYISRILVEEVEDNKIKVNANIPVYEAGRVEVITDLGNNPTPYTYDAKGVSVDGGFTFLTLENDHNIQVGDVLNIFDASTNVELTEVFLPEVSQTNVNAGDTVTIQLVVNDGKSNVPLKGHEDGEESQLIRNGEQIGVTLNLPSDKTNFAIKLKAVRLDTGKFGWDVVEQDVNYLISCLELTPPSDVVVTPPITLSCIFSNEDDSDAYINPFGQYSSMFKDLNKTYLLPRNTAFERFVKVVATSFENNENTVTVSGDYTYRKWRFFENYYELSPNQDDDSVQQLPNSKPYYLQSNRTSYDEASDATTFVLNSSPKDISIGSYLTFIAESGNQQQFNNIALPRVTQQMVNDKAFLKIQAVAYEADGVRVVIQQSTSNYPKDRLQLNGPGSSSTESERVFSASGPISGKFVATSFSEDVENDGLSQLGWSLEEKNVNYYRECLDEELGDETS